MSQQPEQLGQLALLGLPKGATEQPRKKKRAACWSPDENQFAGWAMETWNTTFRGVRGAYRVYNKRHNAFVAISFHRRNQQRPPHERFSQDDIAAAIRAYRNDPANSRLGRWKRFVDWWRDAEENIDFYRADIRVQEHRTEQPRTVKRKVNKQAAAARRVVIHKGIVPIALSAAKFRVSLRDFVGNAADSTPLSREITALIDHRESLGRDAKATLDQRARRVFSAYYQRSAGGHELDDARLDGITLALLDLDDQRAKGRPHGED